MPNPPLTNVEGSRETRPHLGPPPIKDLGRILLWGLLSLYSFTAATACTLDLISPSSQPPTVWDPTRNTHPNAGEFQELLDRYTKRGLPGVVFLARAPQGLWNGAAGFAKIEAAVPMTPSHRHHSASVTKMYTAAAVMLLIEDGLLELDALISVYLPEEVWGPIPNGSKVTVRDLLNHRSGIPDFGGDLSFELDFLNDPLGDYPEGKILSYLHGQSAWCEPGEICFYSNANYFLLALILDEVTAGNHSDLFTRRIFRPLGLDETYYKSEEGYPRPRGLVSSYQDFEGNGRLMNVSDLTIHSAALFSGNAGIIGTSIDFATFLEGLMAGRLVNRETLRWMLDTEDSGPFGLGLTFKNTPFGEAVGHSGADTGVLSEVRFWPEGSVTMVLLSNGGDSGLPEKLFLELWEELMSVVWGEADTRSGSA